jgi:hypothetical protein
MLEDRLNRKLTNIYLFLELQSHPGRQIPGALNGPEVDTSDKLRTQNDIERKLQAMAAKDGIRIKEFFLDFDKLRKGWVGEAAVSFLFKLI